MLHYHDCSHFSDGSWNTSDPVTINVGSAAVPVSKMLPVGDKLWCSCHNTVKIFDTVALQFQVSKNCSLLSSTSTYIIQAKFARDFSTYYFDIWTSNSLISFHWSSNVVDSYWSFKYDLQCYTSLSQLNKILLSIVKIVFYEGGFMYNSTNFVLTLSFTV